MVKNPLSRISRVNTRGRPFQRGNPGRPKGARGKAVTMLEAMFGGEAEEIARKAIELAKRGKMDAIKLVLDRACPPRKGHPVQGVTLPVIASVNDAVAAMGAIAAGVSVGALTIAEAHDLSDFIEIFRKTHELADIERRVVVLERETKRGAGNAPLVKSD